LILASKKKYEPKIEIPISEARLGISIKEEKKRRIQQFKF
jgi:hypothetical protein